MLYLIEHDLNDNPKTRWGQFDGCTISDLIQTLTTFCSCIDYIDNLFIYDSNGKFTPLSKVCDTYNIPYKLKEDRQ